MIIYIRLLYKICFHPCKYNCKPSWCILKLLASAISFLIKDCPWKNLSAFISSWINQQGPKHENNCHSSCSILWLFKSHLVSNCLWTYVLLTRWGRLTHICVGKLTIIDSDNGLSPARCQTIIWTKAGIMFIGPLETNSNEILIGIQTFSFKKMHWKMSSAKWGPFCLGLNVLM